MTADAKAKKTKRDIESFENDDFEIYDKLWSVNELNLCGITLHKNTATCARLFVLFVLLLIAGGGVFHAIEHPNEVKNTNQQIQEHDSAYADIIRILTNHTKVEADALELYGRLQPHFLGFEPTPEYQNQWSLSNSICFSFIIVTTIGYGHFIPDTFGGRMFLIIYAVIGIPIAGLSLGFFAERTLYVFTWLSKVGKDKTEEAFRHFDIDESGELDEDEFQEAVKLLGFKLNSSEFKKLWSQVDRDGNGLVDLDEFRQAIQFMHADVTEAAAQNDKVVITLVGILVWILIGVLIFSLVEDWRLNKTFYFVFVSLTTIGIGDVFPTTILGQGFLIVFAMVGLGLVAVLFTLLETMFSEMGKARKKMLKKAKEKKHHMIQLKQIPIFASMADDQIDCILEKTSTIEFLPNINIINEGTEINSFYILMNGRVVMTEINSVENREISAPSFLFGSAMLENPNLTKSEVTVRTIESVRVLCLSRENWEAISGTKQANLVAMDEEDQYIESSIYSKDMIYIKDLEFYTEILDEDTYALLN